MRVNDVKVCLSFLFGVLISILVIPMMKTQSKYILQLWSYGLSLLPSFYKEETEAQEKKKKNCPRVATCGLDQDREGLPCIRKVVGVSVDAPYVAHRSCCQKGQGLVTRTHSQNAEKGDEGDDPSLTDSCPAPHISCISSHQWHC